MLWHEKRYYSLDSYLKTTYGRKIYKISLDGGMTCPNRDGTIDSRGCIFCSAGGSGDFAASRFLSITEQIEQGKTQTARKLRAVKSKAGEASSDEEHVPRYIAYFQAYTNTYAPVSYLRRIFLEAAMHPDIVLLSIATRPDCLDEDVLALLQEIQQIKPVWIELGLQTIHEETATLIRRGYPLSVYDHAVERLHQLKIPVIVHMILGLPGETQQQMIETLDYVCRGNVFGLKLQLLHILKGTDLADYYASHPFPLFSQEEYVRLIVNMIERIPRHITIHRLTGDGPGDLLIEPRWSTNKKQVLNDINRQLKLSNTFQGNKKEEL